MTQNAYQLAFLLLVGILLRLAYSSPVNYTDLERRWYSTSATTDNPNEKAIFWPKFHDHSTVLYCYESREDYENVRTYFNGAVGLWQRGRLNEIIKFESITGNDEDFCYDKYPVGIPKHPPYVLCVKYDENSPKSRSTVGFTKTTQRCKNYLILGTGSLNLRPNSKVVATLGHEIGHVLGLLHEHQRPDRDNAVIFNCQNLQDYERVQNELRDGDTMEEACNNMNIARKYQFSAFNYAPYPQTSDKNLPCSKQYDISSIMHYPSFSNAKSTFYGTTQDAVLLDRNADISQTLIIQKTGPSISDIVRVWQMYRLASDPEIPDLFNRDPYAQKQINCEPDTQSGKRGPPAVPPNPPYLGDGPLAFDFPSNDPLNALSNGSLEIQDVGQPDLSLSPSRADSFRD